jgi:hypothetical protein
MDSKKCKYCNREFFKKDKNRKYNYSANAWSKANYCSKGCRLKAQGEIDERFTKNHFKKGVTFSNRKPSPIFTKICLNCKNEFSKAKRNGGDIHKFCSQKCSIEYQRGEKSPNYDGGKTKINESIRSCSKYIQTRNACYERDNYTCQNKDCNQIGGKLNADHIKNFSLIIKEYNIKTLEEALKCDALWDLNNLRTLCEPCHKETKHYCGKGLSRK